MRRAIAVTALVACVSCTLLVDTGDLAGGPAGAPDGGGGEGGAVTDNGLFALTLLPPSITIPTPGASADVVVSLVRKNGFAGAVTVSLGQNSLGLQAGSLVLDAATSAGTLSITSSASSTVGLLALDIVGTSGTVNTKAPLAIRIGGAAGTIDTAFGDRGITIFKQGSETHGYSVGFQDAKPLLGGDVVYDGEHELFVARMTLDGKPDPAFDTDGVIALDITPGNDWGSTVSLAADGRLYLFGGSQNPTNLVPSIVRLEADGKLDATFPKVLLAGVPVATGGDPDVSAQFVYESGDKLLIAGNRFFAARIDKTGKLDPTYGEGGIARTVKDADLFAYYSIVTRDGKLVQTGYRTPTGDDHQWAISRLTTDGKPDATFGENGVVTVPFDSKIDEAGGLVETPDGKLLVAGQDGTRAVLLRLLPDGKMDTTFGTDGVAAIVTEKGRAAGSAVQLQGDHLIFVGSIQNGSNFDVLVARFDLNGVLDPTFGTAGMFSTPIGQGDDYGYDVRIAPSGYIYIGGDFVDKGTHAFLMRVWP